MSDLVHVKGLSQLNDFLRQLPEKMERNVLRGALRAGAKPILVQTQANAAHRTGELAKDIKIATSTKGGRVTARVMLTGPHAFVGRWLEFTGAAPHTISARGGHWLFLGGMFAKSVQHPGFHPKPFMRPALDSQAGAAVVAAAEYMKIRLATKNGLDTSDVDVELVA